MPRLMDKKDWMRTVADVGAAESIWHENIEADGGQIPISLPESGMYHVIFVKMDVESPAQRPRRKSAHEYIGCCRKNYSGCASTAEIMKELREGEE